MGELSKLVSEQITEWVAGDGEIVTCGVVMVVKLTKGAACLTMFETADKMIERFIPPGQAADACQMMAVTLLDMAQALNTSAHRAMRPQG